LAGAALAATNHSASQPPTALLVYVQVRSRHALGFPRESILTLINSIILVVLSLAIDAFRVGDKTDFWNTFRLLQQS